MSDEKNDVNIKLSKAVIESFAKFIVPEIRKFYANLNDDILEE